MKTNKVFWIAFVAILALLLAGCNLPWSGSPEATVSVNNKATDEAAIVLEAIATLTAQAPIATPTLEPTVEPTATPTSGLVIDLPKATGCTGDFSVGSSTVNEVVNKRAYPSIIAPDPSRQVVFPDVPCGNVPALAEYGLPWEDGDYFEDAHGDVDVPEWHYRYMTAGQIKIDQLNIDCQGSETRVCAVLIVDESGPTLMYRDAIVDNGFTVAGFVWDMGSVEKVSLAAQRLLDHIVFRTTVPNPNPGANCSTVKACDEVQWYVVVLIDGNIEAFWTGLYQR